MIKSHHESKHPAVAPGATRGAYRAVLIFPVFVILGFIVGLSFSETISLGFPLVNPILGIVMFFMGVTLTPKDFLFALKKPLAIFLTIVGQFVFMPMVAVLVAWMLQLPPEISAGLVLIASVSGGVNSNVITYLARGDVALSIAMTSVSTLLTPIVTPLLALWLAGQYMAVDATGMIETILLVVLLPVILGILVRWVVPKFVQKSTPALPWLSIVGITALIAILVAGTADMVLSAGLIVLLAVFVQNISGMFIGYGLARITGQSISIRRTVSIEIGLQNAALAAGLSAQYMSPVAALPGAVYSVIMNLTGAVFAAWCQYRDRKADRQPEQVVHAEIKMGHVE